MQPTKNSDKDVWRTKYLDTLETLETQERQFRAIEGVLKRLAGRLCVASLGQSGQLDSEIKHLQSVLRRDSAADELEKITSSLTMAINALDQTVAPEPAVASPPATQAVKPAMDDVQLRTVLARLLAELRRDPELLSQADGIDARLSRSLVFEELPDTLERLAQLVGRRIKRIERDKQDLEALLNQMVGRLDEIGQYVVAQRRSQAEQQASSDTLSTQLVGEMRAMGESVESAVELMQLRVQVRTRLDAIGHHLKDFREREASLTSAMQARTQRMQARVAELEAQTKQLRVQLADEQRLATIDRLTRVPNRMAYEKRMQEELPRFERFKQPTCLAVWDVDHFKRFNDTYGHRAGDRVLRVVAESRGGRIRSTDFFGRYGGEEFVMILCGAQPEAVVRILDEMRLGIAQLKLHSNGTPLQVTASSGATMLRTGDTAASAFDRADKALYLAKAAGRNRCILDEMQR